MEFFPETIGKTDSAALATELQAELSQHGWGMWALEHRRDGRFIGFAGIQRIAQEPFAGSVEAGGRLAREYRGAGLATEAAGAAMAFGFEELRLPEIIAFTALPNWRSRRVMEKLGMRDTGRNFMHPRVPRENKLCEHVLYSISRAEYARQN